MPFWNASHRCFALMDIDLRLMFCVREAVKAGGRSDTKQIFVEGVANRPQSAKARALPILPRGKSVRSKIKLPTAFRFW